MTLSDGQVKKGRTNYERLYKQEAELHIKTHKKAKKVIEKLRTEVKKQKEFVIEVDILNNSLEEENRQLKEKLKAEISRTNHTAEIIVGMIILTILYIALGL